MERSFPVTPIEDTTGMFLWMHGSKNAAPIPSYQCGNQIHTAKLFLPAGKVNSQFLT